MTGAPESNRRPAGGVCLFPLGSTAEYITENLIFRELRAGDATALESYFGSLTPESKRRFQPHPLTPAAARELCAAEASPTLRLVVETTDKIIAYFILEAEMSTHERSRYRQFGIALESGKDYLFAPSVSDGYQNRGVASLAMPHILKLSRRAGARSLVLMGGTQATNLRAIAFYEKFGFERFGGYETDVFNHDMRLVLES